MGLLRESNNRVQGWMEHKEVLKPLRGDNDRPGLLVTRDCTGLFRNLPVIQHDAKNVSDCATDPHDITHICDSLRYYAITRTLGAQMPEVREEPENGEVDYDESMTGGEMREDYMAYGG